MIDIPFLQNDDPSRDQMLLNIPLVKAKGQSVFRIVFVNAQSHPGLHQNEMLSISFAAVL